MDVFSWIRAVAKSKISLSCKGFALELIPIIDSKTMMTQRGIGGVSDRVSGSARSIKRHKRQLVAHGLLKPGRGFVLCLPGGVTDLSPVTDLTPVSGLSPVTDLTPGECQDCHPNGDRSVTGSYKGTSASSSTSPSAKASKRARAMTLKDLDEDRRPDMRGREESGGGGEGWVSVEVWGERWKQATGQRWPRSWRSWAGIVLPLLTKAEREEVIEKGEELGGKNLPFWTAVVERLVRESSSASSTRRGGGGGAGRRLPGEEHFPQTYIDERDQFWDKLQERGR